MPGFRVFGGKAYLCRGGLPRLPARIFTLGFVSAKGGYERIFYEHFQDFFLFRPRKSDGIHKYKPRTAPSLRGYLVRVENREVLNCSHFRRDSVVMGPIVLK